MVLVGLVELAVSARVMVRDDHELDRGGLLRAGRPRSRCPRSACPARSQHCRARSGRDPPWTRGTPSTAPARRVDQILVVVLVAGVVGVALDANVDLVVLRHHRRDLVEDRRGLGEHLVGVGLELDREPLLEPDALRRDLEALERLLHDGRGLVGHRIGCRCRCRRGIRGRRRWRRRGRRNGRLTCTGGETEKKRSKDLAHDVSWWRPEPKNLRPRARPFPPRESVAFCERARRAGALGCYFMACALGA